MLKNLMLVTLLTALPVLANFETNIETDQSQNITDQIAQLRPKPIHRPIVGLVPIEGISNINEYLNTLMLIKWERECAIFI